MSLEDLMDLTRDAVLAGDLASLASLAPRVEAAVERLTTLDEETARRLHQKANGNARLLQAASRGVRAAQGRLAEIISGPTLTTYDSRGRKEALTPLSQLSARRF